MTAGKSPPRASLIVRSVGRAELHEALAAAGVQTCASLEIVVVDATGGRHPPVPASSGAHPIVFVPADAPRTRPVAANAGLDAARGDYLGFLDDDDLVLPQHVAGLMAALEAEPACTLAFSIARESRPDATVRRVGHERLSRLMLLEQCFFPPCAALFRRSLLAHCRFDESLQAAEDWDFWLQASRYMPFRFVAQETAIYRAERGRSAMSTGAHDEGERWRNAVLHKWASERAELARETDAAFDQALSMAQQGDTDAAMGHADHVLALYPCHGDALNLRGTLWAMRGNFDAAHRDFHFAVEANPDDPASAFNLAQALQRLGRRDEASAALRRVLALDPSHPHARARLAQI